MATNEFNSEKFKCFVRFMINVAKEKRCVTYKEVENIFGLSHKQAGIYAGRLGDYCIDRELPLLNSLIINTTDCVPSEGYEWYDEHTGMHWERLLQIVGVSFMLHKAYLNNLKISLVVTLMWKIF
ncbi:hypothetical protein DA442_09560 [Vibrio parahaemolyticus]|nr:hypothetical protein [Vibrio parahaemolyticus]AVW95383.1 hypothetical protein DA442_09560 [Vibrio parahaemolyticus]